MKEMSIQNLALKFIQIGYNKKDFVDRTNLSESQFTKTINGEILKHKNIVYEQILQYLESGEIEKRLNFLKMEVYKKVNNID